MSLVPTSNSKSTSALAALYAAVGVVLVAFIGSSIAFAQETDPADTDGDGYISVAEGVPFYGGIVNSLTTEGDTGTSSALALDRFPAADADGNYTYSRTFTLSPAVTDLTDAHIVLHGIDINNDGEYNGEKESSIAPGVPFEATVPAACGEIELVEGDTYRADITELNSSGAMASATLSLTGDQVTVTFDAEGFSPEVAHAQHFHLSTEGDSVCPPNTIGVEQELDEEDDEVVEVPTENIAPTMSDPFAGASAVHLAGEYLFISSNTGGMIGILDTTDEEAEIMTFASEATDADGIYYDAEADTLYQVNRTDNVVNSYTAVIERLMTDEEPFVGASSTSDFTNGRELAVMGDKLVVAQDADDSNGNQNAFVVYEASDEGINYVTTIAVDINLWGVLAVDGDLLAVIDNSNEVAVFEDFFSTVNASTTTSTADAVVAVDGLVRTHGLDYDADSDKMVVTDVGDGAVADDGALVIIKDFMDASADGTITADEQLRIAGDMTMLGNPVDVALDYENMTKYVAERANEGGKLLTFDLSEDEDDEGNGNGNDEDEDEDEDGNEDEDDNDDDNNGNDGDNNGNETPGDVQSRLEVIRDRIEQKRMEMDDKLEAVKARVEMLKNKHVGNNS